MSSVKLKIADTETLVSKENMELQNTRNSSNSRYSWLQKEDSWNHFHHTARKQ